MQQNGLLQVQSGTGTTGLFFGGTASPTLTLNSHATVPGKILLQEDVTVDSSLTSGTAQILSGGVAATAGRIDMNGGTRTWSVNNGSANVDLLVSATLDNGALIKTDTGTMKLTGANTFTGATTVSGGTLELGSTGSLTATTSVAVNTGGTFLLGSSNQINDSANFTMAGTLLAPAKLETAGLNETVGTLTLSASNTISIIDLGLTGADNALRFAGSTGTWTGALHIWNWSGTTLSGGGGNGGLEDDQVFFTGTSTYGTTIGSGLSATQLGQITFYSDSGVTSLGATVFGANGQIVPVPEPTGVLVALGMFGLAGWRERRREQQARRATR